jgi:hypothetical protein
MPTNVESQMPTASQGRTRANNNQQPNNKNRAELLAEPNTSIRTREQARTHLDKHGYLAKEDPLSTEQLSYVLLSLAYNANGKALQEGARAVAILMMEEAAKGVGNAVRQQVEKSLEPILNKIETAINDAKAATEIAKGTAEGAGNLMEMLAGTSRQHEQRTDSGPGSVSYAAALKGNVPLSHPNNLAKAKARAKQILIDTDPQGEQDTLGELTEQELVAKANEAVNNLDEDHDLANIEFIGAKRLTNGGIVFDLDTEEAARWIQTNKKAFTSKFSGTATIKDRALAVIVEYVPLSHSPEALAEMRQIERHSKLPDGSLLATRWIKPVHRRTAGQRSAHIIAKFATTEAANQSIRDGLIIAGKRTWARRMKREPRRCLKCQKYNARHIAAECDSQDTCGTCGGGHRTANCEEDDPRKFKCMNCNADGHASWDRTCPVFKTACISAEKSDPEHTYKFFPNENPWTWEQQNTTEENEDTTNPPRKASAQEGRPRRTEGTGHHNEQQETDKSRERIQKEPESSQHRGRPRRRESKGRDRAGTNPQVGHRDRGWQEREPGEIRQSRLEDYGLGISLERRSPREGNDNNNDQHRG